MQTFTHAYKSILLFALVILVYFPSLHGPFLWDDIDIVEKNVDLRSIEGLWRIWTSIGNRPEPQFYPLTISTFWIEYQIWGINPLGYHITNLILHYGCCLLLWRILSILHIPGAWLAAAIFALHPVHVASVALIMQRKNTLSGILYLAAFLCYWQFLDNKRKYYLAAIILYTLSLLAKTTACSLPVVILIMLWWQKGTITKRDFLLSLPFFIVGIPLGILTAWMEKTTVGASGAFWDYTFLERILIAARAWWFYFGKLLVPESLTFIYPLWRIEIYSGQWLWVAAGFLLLALVWCAQKRVGRAPLAALLFFSITIFPALGFFNIYGMRYSFVFDHYQYLASIGIIALLASTLVHFLSRRTSRMVAIIIVLLLAILSRQRNFVYASREFFWKDNIAKNPNWVAYNNLAGIYRKKGMLDRAIQQLQLALAIKPQVEIYNNLGQLYLKKGDPQKALTQYLKSIDLDKRHPVAYYLLGNVYARQQQYTQAAQMYSQAIQLAPEYVQAYLRLGTIHEIHEQDRQAQRLYQRIIEINPLWSKPYTKLGDIYFRSRRYQRAMAMYRQVIVLSPQKALAYNKIGNCHFKLRQYSRAIDAYLKALLQSKNFVEARNNLTTAYLHAGNYRQAIVSGLEAVALDPNYPKVYTHLGAAYYHIGNQQRAMESLLQAIAVDSSDIHARHYLAMSLFANKKFSQAIQHFQTILSANPQHHIAHWMLAQAYYAQKKYPKALRHYQLAKKAGIAVDKKFGKKLQTRVESSNQ